jgi:hypothetical protein
MKKIILSVAVVGLALASCAKDRTCSCTTTYVDGTTGITTVGLPNTTTLYEVSKKNAKNLCLSTENSGQSTNSAGVVTKHDTETTVCTLK